MKMTKGRVITDDAKYNFIKLILSLGHPRTGLQKQLGLDHSIYDHFLTKRCVRNSESQSLILYLLDFGIKCGLDEALLLREALMEYCARRCYWEPDFLSENVEDMVSSMETKWTWKLCGVIDNIQNLKGDLNIRLKILLLDMNKVRNL